jgi:hypothetical protein
MRDVVILFLHLIVTVVRLARPRGLPFRRFRVAARQTSTTHPHSWPQACAQPASRRAYHRRLCALFMNPTPILRSAIALKPSTLLHLHYVLEKRKYRLLFSRKGRCQPGPKGPNKELIDAVVELKRVIPVGVALESPSRLRWPSALQSTRMWCAVSSAFITRRNLIPEAHPGSPSSAT